MAQTATQALSLTVAAVPVLAITTTSPLPDAAEFSVYVQQMQATGGVPPYFWSISSGALPAGLTLSQSGTLQGTPTASGPFSFTVEVQDSGA